MNDKELLKRLVKVYELITHAWPIDTEAHRKQVSDQLAPAIVELEARVKLS